MNTHQSFDRESFQSLLANSFSVQQSGMKPESLAAIIEIQRVVSSNKVDAQYAMDLVAQRARAVANASGIGVALLEGNQLVHRAGSGSALQNVGSQLAAVLSNAAQDHPRREILRVEDAANDSRIEAEICRQFNVEALLMVPIYREHAMIGVLEIFFEEPHVFSEPEVRTYQLMATLAGDASALQNAEPERKTVSSSTLARALVRMNSQIRQLAVKLPRAPETAPEIAAKSQSGRVPSGLREWSSYARWEQLTQVTARHLRSVRLPSWHLPRISPALLWRNSALGKLRFRRPNLKINWPSWPSTSKAETSWLAAACVILVLAFVAAIARHQSTMPRDVNSPSPTSASTSSTRTEPLVPVSEQQIVSEPSPKPHAAPQRDAGAPSSSFKRVWAGKDEVDYITEDVTIRHFRQLPSPKKSAVSSKQVNIGEDVTVRYFNSPPVPAASASRQVAEKAVKD